MAAKLVAWALQNRFLVIVAGLLVAVLGVEHMLRLPIDAVPDVTNVQVQVLTKAPALAPLEVERLITFRFKRNFQHRFDFDVRHFFDLHIAHVANDVVLISPRILDVSE